jgi:hypothetical protein
LALRPLESEFFQAASAVIEQHGARGARPAGPAAVAKMGAGAARSGQGHLWAGWSELKQEQQAALLEEMLKVRARRRSAAAP